MIKLDMIQIVQSLTVLICEWGHSQ